MAIGYIVADHTENKEKAEIEPRERIFRTALRLFSRHGFNAVGVRQLAREAEVNLAMINYFYGSKIGLLEAILEKFFTGYIGLIEAELTKPGQPLDKFRRMIKAACRFFIRNREMVLISLTEMPRDEPEVTVLKAGWAGQVAGLFRKHIVNDLEAATGKTIPVQILGPAMASLMASHFIFSPVISRVIPNAFGDDFFDTYPDIIADLMIGGLRGLIGSEYLTETINVRDQT